MRWCVSWLATGTCGSKSDDMQDRLLAWCEYCTRHSPLQRQYSVVQIETSETYDKDRPKEKGLSDLRLGTLDRNAKCTTDGMGSVDCPGYFGHLELAKPVFHVGFMTTIMKVLRCVGVGSSKLLLQRVRDGISLPLQEASEPCLTEPCLLSQTDPKFADLMRIKNPKSRLRAFVDACKTKTSCPETQQLQPQFRLDAGKIYAEYKERSADADRLPEPADRKQVREVLLLFTVLAAGPSAPIAAYRTSRVQVFTPERVHEVFRAISDEDVLALGLNPRFARPDWMVLTVLPIPPPNVRPSVQADNGRSEDDLTHKLAEIIRANINLRRQIQNGEPAAPLYAPLLPSFSSTAPSNPPPHPSLLPSLFPAGSPAHVVQEFVDLLQFHISSYFDNTVAGQPRATMRSGRPVKSISERLKGKSGRVRGNLMGKRVNFSARDPWLRPRLRAAPPCSLRLLDGAPSFAAQPWPPRLRTPPLGPVACPPLHFPKSQNHPDILTLEPPLPFPLLPPPPLSFPPRPRVRPRIRRLAASSPRTPICPWTSSGFPGALP